MMYDEPPNNPPLFSNQKKPLSHQRKEYIRHVITKHCPVVSKLWGYAFRSFGIRWVLSGSVMDLLFGWRNWFGKQSSDVWNLVLLCVMWTIWRERNRRIFKDVESPGSQILGLFIGLLFDWSRVWGFTATSSAVDFVNSLCSVPCLWFLFVIVISFVCMLYAHEEAPHVANTLDGYSF